LSSKLKGLLTDDMLAPVKAADEGEDS
jgi:hypothetical protein